MVTGELIGAMAMTEPHAGSDLKAITTSAKRDGNEYVINGAKTFITNGINADLIILVAKTAPDLGSRGVSLILVETDRPGFRRGKRLAKMGMKASDTAELFFDDVRVPVTNLLGEENRGFAQVMSEIPKERLSIATIAMASAQKAFDITVAYVKERQIFGKPLVDFQNTQFKLAELKTQLTVAWAHLDHCIARHMEGKLTSDEAAIAKLFNTELQCRVVDECLQLHGGWGYMSEMPIAHVRRRAGAPHRRWQFGSHENADRADAVMSAVKLPHDLPLSGIRVLDLSTVVAWSLMGSLEQRNDFSATSARM